MYVKIHRASEQIGGNLIEIGTENTRLLFDAGTDLPAPDEVKKEDNIEIEGLTYGTPSFDYVFISHHHNDHCGLLKKILPSIPVFAGNETVRILNVISDFTNQPRPELNFGFRDGVTVQLDDMRVTPLAVTHSAQDAYMFLVQGDNQCILYTGDFRTAEGVTEKIQKLTDGKQIDIMISEGTNILRNTSQSGKLLDEEWVTQCVSDVMKQNDGTVFVLCSSTNEDRIQAICNAAEQNERLVCEDLFMTSVRGKKTGNTQSFIANAVDERRSRIYAYFEKLYSEYKLVGAETLAKFPQKKVIFVRPSMRRFIERYLEYSADGQNVLVYSIWNGYKQSEYMHDFLKFCENKNMHITECHVSGHAYRETIEKLINELNPRVLLPVHCDKNDREEFLLLHSNCLMSHDGVRYDIEENNYEI